MHTVAVTLEAEISVEAPCPTLSLLVSAEVGVGQERWCSSHFSGISTEVEGDEGVMFALQRGLVETKRTHLSPVMHSAFSSLSSYLSQKLVHHLTTS